MDDEDGTDIIYRAPDGIRTHKTRSKHLSVPADRGKVTGYEVAKQTGISRSNAYNSLASMTEKGAAYLVEEASTRKYVPVPLNEFCKNRI